MDSMLREEKCLLGSGVSRGRVERTILNRDDVCLCACGEPDRGDRKTPRPTAYAWQRRSTNTPTTTMATQRALFLLLILLIRLTTGVPVNQPFHSPEDYAMMNSYVRKDVPDLSNIGLLLPVNFTVSRPCLEAIVRELCAGVFYDPDPDERRGNSNTFTCRGEECRLPNLTKYCDKTANITLEEFKSDQQSFGAMVELPDFYSESIPRDEDGPLEKKNNFYTLYGKISERFNVTRVRNIGPSCSRQFYCIVGDCCPTLPEAEVANLLLNEAYNSLERKFAASTKRRPRVWRLRRRPKGRGR